MAARTEDIRFSPDNLPREISGDSRERFVDAQNDLIRISHQHAFLRLERGGSNAQLLLGLLPSCYAYFFFAFYPSDLAAINMDRSGTTRIGKYLLNHSFMIPGWIGVIVSTIVAYGLVQMYF